MRTIIRLYSVSGRMTDEYEALKGNLPQCPFSATHPTLSDEGSNLGYDSGKPAGSHLNCGMAQQRY
jgi:hypothetical protein